MTPPTEGGDMADRPAIVLDLDGEPGPVEVVERLVAAMAEDVGISTPKAMRWMAMRLIERSDEIERGG